MLLRMKTRKGDHFLSSHVWIMALRHRESVRHHFTAKHPRLQAALSPVARKGTSDVQQNHSRAYLEE